MLDDAPNQPSKFKTKCLVEINDEPRGTLNEYKQIRFKTSMLRLCLCDDIDAYIVVNGTITITPAKLEHQIMLIKRQYFKIVQHLLTV